MSAQVYTVERVVAKRVVKGVTQYLLKWEGYPDSGFFIHTQLHHALNEASLKTTLGRMQMIFTALFS